MEKNFNILSLASKELLILNSPYYRLQTDYAKYSTSEDIYNMREHKNDVLLSDQMCDMIDI